MLDELVETLVWGLQALLNKCWLIYSWTCNAVLYKQYCMLHMSITISREAHFNIQYKLNSASQRFLIGFRVSQ